MINNKTNQTSSKLLHRLMYPFLLALLYSCLIKLNFIHIVQGIVYCDYKENPTNHILSNSGEKTPSRTNLRVDGHCLGWLGLV